jgi:hypothetical protein
MITAIRHAHLPEMFAATSLLSPVTTLSCTPISRVRQIVCDKILLEADRKRDESAKTMSSSLASLMLVLIGNRLNADGPKSEDPRRCSSRKVC